jgi:hypothetical protein
MFYFSGASVYDCVDEKTTHLVAARLGTAKVKYLLILILITDIFILTSAYSSLPALLCLFDSNNFPLYDAVLNSRGNGHTDTFNTYIFFYRGYHIEFPDFSFPLANLLNVYEIHV